MYPLFKTKSAMCYYFVRIFEAGAMGGGRGWDGGWGAYDCMFWGLL
jgi:hypothetical protein